MFNLSTAPFPIFAENGVDLISKYFIWNWANRSKALKIAEEFVTLFDAFPIHSAALNVRNGFDIDGRGVHVIRQYIRHFTDFVALHSQLVYQNLK